MKNRLNETKEERIGGLLGMEKWKGGQIARERKERTASDTKISRWNVKLGASSHRHTGYCSYDNLLKRFLPCCIYIYIYIKPQW